jgi:hypothetical protein
MSLVTIGLKAFPKPSPITTPKLEALLLRTPRVALDLSRAVSLLVTWTFLILYFQNFHNVTVAISDSGSVVPGTYHPPLCTDLDIYDLRLRSVCVIRFVIVFTVIVFCFTECYLLMTGLACINSPLLTVVNELKKSKAVSLHAIEALGRRGDIAPTHSRPRH